MRAVERLVSKASLTISLLIIAAMGGIAAMVAAVDKASARSSLSGTTRATRFALSASLAFIILPVRHISMALALPRSEEHTSELQSLMRTSYAVFCLKKKHKLLKQKRHLPTMTNHERNN